MDFHALLKKEIADTNRVVNEWTGDFGGETVTLCSKPLTPADNHTVLSKYPDFNNSMDLEGMAMYIALKAETTGGEKAFSVARDLPLLKRLGQNKVGEIFQALFAGQIDEIDANGDDHEDRVGK